MASVLTSLAGVAAAVAVMAGGGASAAPTARGAALGAAAGASMVDGSHFWDCNGGGCDAGTLQPWNSGFDFVYAPEYAPVEPFGADGAKYGEKLWMTAATSDSLSALLGADDPCCGHDNNGTPGCGKCMLVSNAQAINADWKVLVMKKSRCPPWSKGCGNGQKHLDLAVPGYDNLEYSTANVCGAPSRADTFLSKAESGTCGMWYKNPDPDTTKDCDCSKLPANTAEQRQLRKGCELFTAWGWRNTGAPQLQLEVVECPSAYKQYISSAFGPSGPVFPST